MEYLYHGSPIKVDELVPSQAFDIQFDEGCQLAVYATSNKTMAICFALGCVPNGEAEVERTMMPEYGEKMIFKNGHPNYGGKGYLYKVDKSKFYHAMGSQWVCFEKIVPEEIIEIEVDEYLDYCVVI